LVIRGSEYVHRADLSRQTAVEPHTKPLNGEISRSASVTGNDVAEFPRTTVGRRREEVELADPIVYFPAQYTKKPLLRPCALCNTGSDDATAPQH